MGGGNTVGEVSGQATSDAMNLGNLSIEAMANRYQQLGLGGTGTQPLHPHRAARDATPGVPGSGTSPTIPGSFSDGGSTGGSAPGATPTAFGGPAGSASNPSAFGAPGGSSAPAAPGATPPGSFAGAPTAFLMDAGLLPSVTGGIPREFQAALGEAQFQDLGQTASAAAGSAQAKGQTFSGIGSALGGLGGI